MYLDYLCDPRTLSMTNFFRNNCMVGMDYIFDKIPKKVPFDYQGFVQAKEKLVVGTTDCETGQGAFFEKDQCDDISRAIRASCSVPILTPIFEYFGNKLLDGGIADPIPIKTSETDGNRRHVVILTSLQDRFSTPPKLR